MVSDDFAASLPGSDEVKRWYGAWPSFHDAEILSLSLARRGESILRVYPSYPDRPATVNFVFEKISDLELADFSVQSVIFSLGIEEVADQNKRKAIRLTMSPCYGLAGYIDAKHIRVRLEPGTSPDAEW